MAKKKFADQIVASTKRTMAMLANSDAVKVPKAQPSSKATPLDAESLKARLDERKKAKPVVLKWNGQEYPLAPDADGRYNLNDLHRKSGYSVSKRPGNWKLSAKVVDLIEKYSTANILAVKTVEGRNGGGTWAIEPLVYAYASYLSNEFYKAVLDAFTAAVHGDMVKVKEIVRTAVRQEGVPIRKEFASTFMSTDPRAEAIEFATDQINLAVTGKTAEGIKGSRTEGFNKSTPTRDRMTDDELKAIAAIEALTTLKIKRVREDKGYAGRSAGREALHEVCEMVKGLGL